MKNFIILLALIALFSSCREQKTKYVYSIDEQIFAVTSQLNNPCKSLSVCFSKDGDTIFMVKGFITPAYFDSVFYLATASELAETLDTYPSDEITDIFIDVYISYKLNKIDTVDYLWAKNYVYGFSKTKNELKIEEVTDLFYHVIADKPTTIMTDEIYLNLKQAYFN